MRRRSIMVLALCAAMVGGPVAAAGAANDQSEIPAKCLQAGPNGELPTCSKDGSGEWTASYPDDGLGGGGIPGGIVVLMVMVAIGGAGFTLWKVSMARQTATDAGMDPGMATAV